MSARLDALPGRLPDGRTVRRITLENAALSVSMLDLGAALHDVRHRAVDLPLLLGGAEAGPYARILSHFGAVMGPVANRIAGAQAWIGDTLHRFEANQDGRHSLHSGAAGLHLKTWDIADYGDDHVTFACDLPDGEGGFPGRRRVVSRYTLDGDTITHEQTAETDAPTLVNLAIHPYWTMQPPGSWAGQWLTIHADRYLPTTDEDLPTGEIAPVAGTPFDFRDPVRLDPGALPRLDHNFCLTDAPGPLRPALRLSSERTGLALEIETTAPGLQLFGMHKFGVEGEPTLHGHDYPPGAALAIEPQMWPDAPGRPDWPSILLEPARSTRQISRYRVSGS